MLFPDQELLNKLKNQADKYLELYKANGHWKISTKELENWYRETKELGEKFITAEDNLIEYRELGKFISCKDSIYNDRIAVNIKHNMKTTIELFYSIFCIIFKKLYGKSYPRENLPNIV
ncbi:unnamed protein product [marine sediment metagenome]|uniref:Uncharacterized protein n=1 Tax=marine sediment metagenome TaxID=412755 RepID=X1IDP2_9ZZZZ